VNQLILKTAHQKLGRAHWRNEITALQGSTSPAGLFTPLIGSVRANNSPTPSACILGALIGTAAKLVDDDQHVLGDVPLDDFAECIFEWPEPLCFGPLSIARKQERIVA
jgi:hypothetical protein